MNRNNLVSIIVGKRGSGKTFFTRSLIKSYPRKVLIMDTFDHPSYKDIAAIKAHEIKYMKSGICRVYGSDTDFIFDQIASGFRNGLVVFEDCTKYIRYSVPDNIRKYIIDTKQLNVDCLFLYHGLGMVQPDLYRLADVLEIFKVQEDIKRYQDKIPNFAEVKKVFEEVQKNDFQYFHKSVRLY